MRVRATRLFAISGGGRRGQSVFAGAAAAYAVRLPANSTYSGPLLRVRRSNDNAEQDIFAGAAVANGNRFIDTTALLAFTGANSGFITTFYDPSGNGRNATQTTAAFQARIVNAGVVDTLNGVPAPRFLGNGTTGNGYTFTNTASQPNTIIIVYRMNSFILNAHITDGSSTSARRLVGFNGTIRQMFAGGVATYGTQATGVSQTWATVFNGGSSLAVVDGAASGTLFVGSQTMGLQIFGGGQGDSGGFVSFRAIDGWIQEYLVFNSVLTTAQILAIQRNQGAAYGITVA